MCARADIFRVVIKLASPQTYDDSIVPYNLMRPSRVN